MPRRQAFKFRLRPTGDQQRLMRQYAGSCRFVYNRALALQQARYEAGQKHLNYKALCAALTGWKQDPDTAWLNNMPSQALQQALYDLTRAYTNFFEGRARYPTFRKKGIRDRFRYPQGFKLDERNGRVFLPRIGWLRYRQSRKIQGTIKNVTVGFEGGHWTVAIQTEREVAIPQHPSTSMVGMDVGVATFATLSDGTVIESPHHFRRLERRLAREQRRLARKVKFSSNWQKQKARMNRLHRRIANQRHDCLHKTSLTISQNHAMVAIEDLNVQNMSRSAKGTAAQPGKQVRQKAGLNKAILDQGWQMFRRLLAYKLQWQGGELLAVSPAYTSQTCAMCGHATEANRFSQSGFYCVACGHAAHADHNAARNILAAGHAVMACGGAISPPMRSGAAAAAPAKQEPAEASGPMGPNAVGIPAL